MKRALLNFGPFEKRFVRIDNKLRKQSQRHLSWMMRKHIYKRIYDISVVDLWLFERSFVRIYNKSRPPGE
jgi:hypothetical protein